MRVIVVLATIVVAISERADAYPQFQLSLGADRCTACHLSPAGGGLINAYGRDEAGGTVSAGGDGRFAHGVWEPPEWLALGADLRFASAFKAQGGDRELLAFPMQADVYVRAGGEALSFALTVGLRGGARDPQPRLVERIASREHYLMYQRENGSYLRAGRFFPVFGIRSQDHTAFVRRYLGFHTLEEPYGIGAGWFADSWEAHVSAYVPRPIEFLGAGLRASGATVYAEKRLFEDTAAIAGQARVAKSDTDVIATTGVVGKRWFPEAEIMLLGEIDLQRQQFASSIGPTRYQLAAYGGASTFVARGWMVGTALHWWQPDLRARSARTAFQLDLQYFPRAHVELHLLARAGGAGDLDDPGLLTLLQLHYYL
ncbi:MAG: hypothetical protein ACKV2T_22590 [Kofleriaceae bacterium]